MSRGYSCCQSCNFAHGEGYKVCAECLNGDGFSSIYDEDEDDCKMVIYDQEEIEYIQDLYKRDKAVNVKIANGKYYCPSCIKQQKHSYKNRLEGCFCERCGQRLAPFDC